MCCGLAIRREWAESLFAVLLRGWMDVAAPTRPPASVQLLVTRGIHDHPTPAGTVFAIRLDPWRPSFVVGENHNNNRQKLPTLTVINDRCVWTGRRTELGWPCSPTSSRISASTSSGRRRSSGKSGQGGHS